MYVPLATVAGERDKRQRNRRPEAELEQEEKPQLLLDLLNQDSLYVSGDPGSGKSTFCRWIG